MKRWSWAFGSFLLASCQVSTPSSHTYPASSEDLAGAVRAELSAGGEVEERNGAFETGWQDDEAARRSWRSFGRPLRGESRYAVTMTGTRLEVSAGSRVFVSFGPHAHRWEEGDWRAAEQRLLDRIAERLAEQRG
jgi:hypothetical protein